MKKILFSILRIFVLSSVVTGLGLYIIVSSPPQEILEFEDPQIYLWNIQSIDTMKYSRDLSRAKFFDQSFDQDINQQVTGISSTGANYIAIGTPYDKEFKPFMLRWLEPARSHGLKIWFRGNWSGWEEWFDYPGIGPKTHIKKTEEFILNNSELFEDGDIFSPCPECENGGPGDPRYNWSVKGYRDFLIELHETSVQAFKKIEKDVSVDHFSMNGDVAWLVMDATTTSALGNTVTLDHYVYSVDRLINDIDKQIERSQGDIVLGELGVPVPDIHGYMTEQQQADWIEEAFSQLIEIQELKGVNYWVNVGGSTGIWSPAGKGRKAVSILEKYFKPLSLYGVVVDELNYPIAGATVSTESRSTVTNNQGYFELPFVPGVNQGYIVSAEGYTGVSNFIDEPDGQINIVLESKKETMWFRIQRLFQDFNLLLNP